MTLEAEASPAFSQRSLVVILGAGRLGLHLAAHLSMAGLSSIHLWNRSPLPPEREKLLADSCSSTPLTLGELPRAALAQARVVLLTVVDDALVPLADRLARAATRPDCVFLHCSGALTGEVLESLRRQGRSVGSMHPLQSFSGMPARGGLRSTFFAIEGDEEALEKATQLVEWLEGTSIRLRPEGKVLYHTAAVVASNLFVALSSIAVGILEGATASGTSEGRRLELLLPLIEGTVSNLRSVGLPRALTGPISRGDVGVVERQLEALGEREQADPSELLIYRLLSVRALELARAQGLPIDQCRAIKSTLAIGDSSDKE